VLVSAEKNNWVANLKTQWVCKNCGVNEGGTPVKRNGPEGDETLCNSCGIFYLQTGELDPDVGGIAL
jgi:hypothetical protein